jgi:ubiquinol oxidase
VCIPQDSIIVILDALYRDRDYARFFVLETIATRVPYFGERLV